MNAENTTEAPARPVTLDTSDKNAMAIYRRAFPTTNFRSLTVKEFRGPKSLNSYWDSGYRDYFTIVPIAAGAEPLKEIPQNGTPFDGKNLELSELPAGFALAVRHYAGTRQYGTLYLNSDNLTRMLPAPAESLTWNAVAVLACTCGLKSFARREQAARLGLTAADWAAGLAELQARQFVNRAGAITNDGRNLVRSWPGCGCGISFHTLAQTHGRAEETGWSEKTRANIATFEHEGRR